MNGKTVLVTGATAGIGRQTALDLAKRGAHVVVVGRDAAKTEQVVTKLRAESGNPNVDSLLADFSALDGVRALADTFHARFGVLHVLVNNVGAVYLERGLSADGHELTFAVTSRPSSSPSCCSRRSSGVHPRASSTSPQRATARCASTSRTCSRRRATSASARTAAPS